MSKLLKEQGCEYIIALTHMLLHNDRILAEQCQDEINLILGGHDHISVLETIGNVTLIKSGSDFQEFSDLKIDIKSQKVERQRVLITKEYEPDPKIMEHIATYAERMGSQMN